MQPTILITGATGYIGNTIVNQLAKAGFTVRAISTSAQQQGNENIEWIVGDITVPETLSGCCNDIATIVHCAARKNDEADSKNVNVHGTQNLVTGS